MKEVRHREVREFARVLRAGHLTCAKWLLHARHGIRCSTPAHLFLTKTEWRFVSSFWHGTRNTSWDFLKLTEVGGGTELEWELRSVWLWSPGLSDLPLSIKYKISPLGSTRGGTTRSYNWCFELMQWLLVLFYCSLPWNFKTTARLYICLCAINLLMSVCSL